MIKHIEERIVVIETVEGEYTENAPGWLVFVAGFVCCWMLM